MDTASGWRRVFVCLRLIRLFSWTRVVVAVVVVGRWEGGRIMLSYFYVRKEKRSRVLWIFFMKKIFMLFGLSLFFSMPAAAVGIHRYYTYITLTQPRGRELATNIAHVTHSPINCTWRNGIDRVELIWVELNWFKVKWIYSGSTHSFHTCHAHTIKVLPSALVVHFQLRCRR